MIWLYTVWIICYRVGMFSCIQCSEPGCKRYAIHGRTTCFIHTQDKESVLEEICSLLSDRQQHHDIILKDADFSQKDFSGTMLAASSFSRCLFHDIDFSKSHINACFFDFCLFERCLFKGCDGRHSVFAGSKFISCDFSDSLLIHANFMGIDARDCDFSTSDLYYSNFSSSHLIQVQFVDCNLKNVDFRFTDRVGVSFRYSNYEEACFTQN